MDISPKIFGSTYIAQSPRKCLNFKILAKIEGKEANFFSKIYQGHIRIWFKSKKNSKLFHACVPLTILTCYRWQTLWRNAGCSARDWDRIRITWGNPQSGCTDVCSYSKRATVDVRAPMWPSETPVWSESSVDERNLYFARSTIIGLAVET